MTIDRLGEINTAHRTGSTCPKVDPSELQHICGEEPVSRLKRTDRDARDQSERQQGGDPGKNRGDLRLQGSLAWPANGRTESLQRNRE